MSKILFLRSRTHTRVGIYYFVMAVAAIAGFSGFAVARTSTNRHSTNLRSDFLHPPAKYRTYVWWHWMGLTISQYGIKRDLTAMKKAGVAGATICLLASQAGTAPNIANSGVPAVHYWSPKFWRMVAYAVKIAKRLHLKLGMENCPGWSASGGPWISPALSMKKFVWTMTSVKGPGKIDRTLQKPPIVLHVYHDICVLAVPVAKTVQPDRILNISTDMNKKGVLTWHAPAGMWHIYRYGYTSEGTTDHPVPDGVHSLEADKLSAKAATFQIEHVIHALQSHLGRSIGHTFTHVLFDSYEAGPQTWTGNFRRDFIALRHYDPLPWLPALNGVVVGSRGQSQRFIYDFTRTIEQEFRRNDFDVYHRLIDAAGLKMCLEPYHGPFNSIACAASCDVTMGEFWNHSRKPFGLYASAADRFNGEALRPVTNPAHRFTNIDTDFAGQTVGKLQQFYFNRTRSGIDLDVAGAARADGRKVVGSETLTGAPWDSRMTETPASLKPELDGGFLSGVNRCYLHDWTLQALNKKYKPGILMGCFGTHFGENQTWFKPGIAFFTYINRCQTMLQQGSQVCDICTLNSDPQALSEDALSLSQFEHATVLNGKITLPDGRAYAVMQLPNSSQMLPKVAQKLRELVAAGATVIGPRPTQSPSLTDYPKCDSAVAAIGRAVWGDCDGVHVKEHRFDKGLVVWNKPMSAVLTELGIQPDFSVATANNGRLVIQSAIYAAPGAGREVNVTALLRRNVRQNGGKSLSMRVDNAAFGGDPAYGHVKYLTVKYTLGGKAATAHVPENSNLSVPFFSLTAIHRHTRDMDIYFVVNRSDQMVHAVASFRVSGKVPELWQPDSGRRITDGEFTNIDGRTNVPLTLGPLASVFVVFRHSSAGLVSVTAIRRNNQPSNSTSIYLKPNSQLEMCAARPGKLCA